MKNIDRISSLEELSAKLEVNVDSVVKEFYFAVKGHIEFYQDDISVNPRTLRTIDSASLILRIIEDYFEALGVKMDFVIDLDSPFFSMVRGYAFSQMIDMVTSLRTEGCKIFTEIDYPKQEIQFALI